MCRANLSLRSSAPASEQACLPSLLPLGSPHLGQRETQVRAHMSSAQSLPWLLSPAEKSQALIMTTRPFCPLSVFTPTLSLWLTPLWPCQSPGCSSYTPGRLHPRAFAPAAPCPERPHKAPTTTTSSKHVLEEFPAGSVVRTPRFHWRGLRFHP